jgi:hypothetical protein
MEKIQDIDRFIYGGHAIFTLKNEETENRFTYKIVNSNEEQYKNYYHVYLLTGCDNESNYSYLGFIKDKIFVISNKSRMKDGLGAKTMMWFVNSVLRTHHVPKNLGIYHNGRCGRCGRLLTVPESIKSGFGPECINRL